jgi:HlyD family type I secretion membrane fusion protein
MSQAAGENLSDHRETARNGEKMMQDCPGIYSWHREVSHSAKGLVLFGGLILLFWGVGFGVWAALAPIASAVVASGSFVATGQNKQVQHLEGGIIRDLLVKEGDVVEANQPLLRLDDTAAISKLRRLVVRQSRLLATSARLHAEIIGSDELQLPAALTNVADDSEVQSIVQSQKAELGARRRSLANQEEVLRKEIAGLKESIRGYEAQADSNRARFALFDEELKAKAPLIEHQLIRKSEILALQRSEVGLQGELGDLLGRSGDAAERIARAEQQIAQLRLAAIEKASEEQRATDTELDDLREQILAAQDVVRRTEVRAPVRGIVVKLNQYTTGGVIAPGGVILELLPVNDELVIEARVNPNEITHVKEGQNALVRLTAFNQRLTPMIQGKVIYVSADTVIDQAASRNSEQESGRRDSFIVRVRLDERDARNKVENFSPSPGMPADIFVETGQRTFFTYLMRPVVDSFSRAFREH